jgi:hypothetical protein
MKMTMATLTSVLIYTKIPRRDPSPEDQNYLCYDEDSPIPWDQDVIFLKDSHGRTWFCVEVQMHLSEQNLYDLAHRIKQEHMPTTMVMQKKRYDNPLLIQIVASRANGLNELTDLLSNARLQGR